MLSANHECADSLLAGKLVLQVAYMAARFYAEVSVSGVNQVRRVIYGTMCRAINSIHMSSTSPTSNDSCFISPKINI